MARFLSSKRLVSQVKVDSGQNDGQFGCRARSRLLPRWRGHNLTCFSGEPEVKDDVFDNPSIFPPLTSKIYRKSFWKLRWAVSIGREDAGLAMVRAGWWEPAEQGLAGGGGRVMSGSCPDSKPECLKCWKKGWRWCPDRVRISKSRPRPMF